MSPTNQRRRRRGGGKNNGPPPYNRPPIHDGRYGPSPGPPTAYPGHDIYNPGIGGAPYAADYSNDYGSQSELWRSEASFYPRPPSPDPYGYQPGPSTGGWAPQSWDHPTPPQWPDRAEPSPRFDGDPWTYDRPDAMTMAQPMFEPNDSWKQHHTGPPNTSRNDVAPEPYSPTRRLPPRFARDHYSPPRPLASDHYTVPTPGPPPFDQYPSGPGLVGQPPPTDHYFPGPSLNAPPPPGDHYPPGTNGLPYPGDHYSPGPSMSAPPFSGDHYSPPGLSGPPPFSGDHYSPGRSLNAPGYSGDRYRPETPPIYPYMNPGSDSYRPRYDDIPEPRAAHPPNPRVHPRWRLPSPERAPSIRGRASPESPNATKRVWEPRRTPPRELNSVDRLSPTRWSPSDPRREPRRIPSRGRSVTRSPSPSRGRSPLYSPRASRSPVRRQTRSPSRNRSPLYSPRASRSPIRGRTRSPIALRSPVGRKRRLRSPTLSYSPRRSRSRSPLPPRIARRYSRRSYTRSPSSSYDSYRASRARRSRGRRRSESRESVVDSRSKARSRSRGRSRSRASTLYSPTTTRLYSPILTRRRVSPARGRGRSGGPTSRRAKPSGAARRARPSSPSRKPPSSKRTSSTESTGSIYGPEIPPELRVKKIDAVAVAQGSRASSLSSYKSDGATSTLQGGSIPGLSNVGNTVPAVGLQSTQEPHVSSSQGAQGASQETDPLHQAPATNDELRAAVAKLVSERPVSIVLDTADKPNEESLRPSLNVNGISRPPSVQIPPLDRDALQRKAEREEGESDMDMSLPATPTDEVAEPVEAPVPEVSSVVEPRSVPSTDIDTAEESDMDMEMEMDVDMDMSAPPSPIIQPSSALVDQKEESAVQREDDFVMPSLNTATERTVEASQSASVGPDIPSGLSPVPGDHSADTALASASSDDSVIPGLSFGQEDVPAATPSNDAPMLKDSSVDDKADDLAIPGLTIVPPVVAQNDEPSETVETRASGDVVQAREPSMQIPVEEDECDMDMSPPPSPGPTPQSPRLDDISSVGSLQPEPDAVPVLSIGEPLAGQISPAPAIEEPSEAHEESSPVADEASTASARTSPVAVQASLPTEVPAVPDQAPVAVSSNSTETILPTEASPSPSSSNDAPQEESPASRDRSPMMVESLLGLTEPPPAAESSVVADDSHLVEASPTAVESSPTSPITEKVVPSEREEVTSQDAKQAAPVEVTPDRPSDVEAEDAVQERPAVPAEFPVSQKVAEVRTGRGKKAATSGSHHGEPARQAPSESPTPEVDPLTEGLRVVVRARLRYDRQTKAERVAPVLMANMTIAEPHDRHDPSADRLCAEVLQGKRKREREDSFVRVRPSLQVLFAQRQASLTEKVKKLREDYLTLHDRWMAHCGKLDEVAKAAALEEAAATAGRTTRRSAALGDAVRTDLEMEQIIASLGNEELTDADHLSSRNAATIPDMISVTKGSVDYRYDDTNNVVEDLVNFYTPNTCLEDWTEEEKEIFLEKYMLYPKQFGIIADFLPNKTTAECVTYYYLHKKTLIDFRKVLARTTAGKRKRGGGRGGKKKGNALLEDIRKHDAEVSRNSTASGSTTRRRRGAQTAENGEPVPRRASTRKSAIQAENSPGTTPTPDPDPEPRKRRRTAKPTARAAAAAEQEVDEDATEAEPKPAKRTRRSRKIKSAETVESPVMSEAPLLFNETRFIDQTELTARKRTPTGSSPWTEEDKELFVKLLAHHGDDFKRISASMPNKTAIQLSAYYKANNAELKLGKVAAQGRRRSPSLEPPASDGYREMSLPGSGVITPSTRASTPSVVQNSTSSANFEAQFRLDDPSAVYKSKLRASAPNSADTEQRPISRPGSSLAAPSSASSGNLQFRPTSLETMRAQYGTSSDALPRHFPLQSRPSPFASVIPPPLTMNGSPFVDTGRPIRPAPRTAGPGSSSGSGSGSGSGPLTMTFPSSFAYSNLSPSHFSGEQRLPPRGYTMRGASPGSAPASATMMFEASVFAPPGPVPMIRVASPFTFRADAAGVEESPVMPATLQTTEDLVAYLEHRSRFAEPRESDFM